jgi:CRISPR-associated exonuclease Cas4
VAEDDDLVPISALQHWLFCPRQAALIHVERLWADDVATVEGRLAHERVHEPGAGSDGPRRVVRSMPLRSSTLGVAGIADVVELERAGDGWRAFPVEHKRGRPKAHRADEVQLCAQGMCLEEMLGTPVPEGALFYGAERRRTRVALDPELRALTARVAAEVRGAIAAGRTPPPVHEARRCGRCSLRELCRPERLDGAGPVATWLARTLAREDA